MVEQFAVTSPVAHIVRTNQGGGGYCPQGPDENPDVQINALDFPEARELERGERGFQPRLQPHASPTAAGTVHAGASVHTHTPAPPPRTRRHVNVAPLQEVGFAWLVQSGWDALASPPRSPPAAPGLTPPGVRRGEAREGHEGSGQLRCPESSHQHTWLLRQKCPPEAGRRHLL